MFQQRPAQSLDRRVNRLLDPTDVINRGEGMGNDVKFIERHLGFRKMLSNGFDGRWRHTDADHRKPTADLNVYPDPQLSLLTSKTVSIACHGKSLSLNLLFPFSLPTS
jgi:hypothetical protein